MHRISASSGGMVFQSCAQGPSVESAASARSRKADESCFSAMNSICEGSDDVHPASISSLSSSIDVVDAIKLVQGASDELSVRAAPDIDVDAAPESKGRIRTAGDQQRAARETRFAEKEADGNGSAQGKVKRAVLELGVQESV